MSVYYNVKPSNADFSLLQVRGAKVDAAKSYIRSLKMIPLVCYTDGKMGPDVRTDFNINPARVWMEIEDNTVIKAWIS